MSHLGGGKNPPWARNAGLSQHLNPQMFHGGQVPGIGSAMGSGLVPAGQMGLGGLGLGAAQLLAMNQAAFAHQQNLAADHFQGFPQVGRVQGGANQGPNKSQRAFIGVVTKLHENYGFVDDDVFFQMTVVQGPVPRVGERVMVEAVFNPQMPFKWNASRIQVLPHQEQHQQVHPTRRDEPLINERDPRGPPPRDMGQSRGPPPVQQQQREPIPPRRDPRLERERERSPPPRPLPVRRPPSKEPSPRRTSTSGSLKRERSRSRQRSLTRETDRSVPQSRGNRSPPRRRARIIPRYSFKTFERSLSATCGSSDLHQRYSNLYVPSDFIHGALTWMSTFPLHHALGYDHHASYHIMHKDVDPLTGVESATDPPDADHRYAAKVMLLAAPSLVELYKRTFGLRGDCTVDTDNADQDFQHVSRVISFLVGCKGKSELLPIGGFWSPSLDGPNPDSDPTVLVRTAIRTTRALTGIDLSKCTQWYKFLEFRYRRIDKERQPATTDQQPDAADTAAARIDTVVLYLPDVWSCVPTRGEFDAVQAALQTQLEQKIAELNKPPPSVTKTEQPQLEPQPMDTSLAFDDAAAILAEHDEPAAAAPTAAAAAESDDGKTVAEDEQELMDGDKPIATHWSKLEFQKLKVAELRDELEARGLDTKGVKSQLVARLQTAVKAEQQADEAKSSEELTVADEVPKEDIIPGLDVGVEEAKKDEPSPDAAKAEAERLKAEKEAAIAREKAEKLAQQQREKEERERKEKKAQLERHFTMPTDQEPCVLVFPNTAAKSGKFSCSVKSLGTLLDYHLDDNKEHSFEVALFAEMFQEMLARDAAFRVYKALVCAPTDKKTKKGAASSDDGDDTAKGGADSVVSEKATVNGDETPQNMDFEVKDEVIEGDKSQDKSVDSEGKASKPIPKRSSIVRIRDPALLAAFTFFDQAHCGYLMDKDLEHVLGLPGLLLSRAQVQKLLQKMTTRGETLSYKMLTEVPEGEDPDQASLTSTLSDEELAKGNRRYLPDESTSAGVSASRAFQSKTGDATTVTFRGTVINVGQVLDQLERLEKERSAVDSKNVLLEKDLKAAREKNDELDKKRKRLDDSVRDYRRKLHDTEKSLKTTQDERDKYRTSLTRAKDSADSIVRLVEKTLPKPPRKDEPSKKEKDEKSATGELKEQSAVEKEAEEDAAKSYVKEEVTQGPGEDEELAIRDEISENNEKMDGEAV